MPDLKLIEQASVVSLLTTELNSLANNTNSSPSSAFDNSIGQSNLDGYVRGKIEVYLATYTGTPAAGSAIHVWFLKTVDGTNYEDTASPRRPDVVIEVANLASGPQRVIKECWVPVGLWKAMARNGGTGLTLAASGNTVKIRLNTDSGV